MKKILLLVLLTPIAAFAANHLKPGFIACPSEQAFENMEQSIYRKDDRGIRYSLEQDGCYATSVLTQFEYSILEPGAASTKIRLYGRKGALEMWTNSEATK